MSFVFGLLVGLCLLCLSHMIPESPVNPDGCRTNCTGTTIAYDLRARGLDVTCRSFDPEVLDEPYLIRETIYPDAKDVYTGTFQRLKKGLLTEGGLRGYVRYARKDGSRHMVAYVCEKGRAYIVDAQTSLIRVPLWLYRLWDRGEDYSFARLDDIDYRDCELLWRILKRGENNE